MAGRRVPPGSTTGRRLDYPDRRLPDLIAERARERPDAIAVRQWDEAVTYRELLAAAGALGATLRGRGAGPEVLVGVCADRRPPLVAGLLGVLLSGAAYVPLDPSLPPARLRDIAAEAGLGLVVGDGALFAGAVPIPEWTVDPAEPPECPAGPTCLAYVMFTSGSTGRPKGVAITHDALTQFVTSLAADMALDDTCRSVAFASIAFDVSLIDMWTPLAVGGVVALAGTADRVDPARLQRFCEEHRVTYGEIPPAILPLLDPARLPDFRLLITGSEAPGPEQVARWSTPDRRFVNCYGPTETTVQVTTFTASGSWDRPLPIGRPTPNHRVYVADGALRQVGVGVPGELLIGGPGLARGYLGAPGLTAERFVPDPFTGTPGARLYRSGDLVTWEPDGTLAFLGRADRQVKVRGQRVEIGEVEAVLRGHPDVGHAVVVAVPGPNGLELVAFVTGQPSDLRGYCAERLPAAMVPGRFLAVDHLPLQSTGKVDVDRLLALAEPVTALPDRPFDPPATPEEIGVAGLWATLLGLARVGRDDDFFDGGGHSITAMRLVAAVRARLGKDVSVEDVLAGRTLAAVSARVAAAPALASGRAVRGRPPALSAAQQRLWFLDRYAPEASAAYNIAFAERLRGPLDVAALRAALDAVAARHEVLRWRIPARDGVPYAVVDPPSPVPLPVESIVDGELAARLAAGARERFDLATDRLWRARLYRLGPDDHVFAYTAHHAVFDGWSHALLYDDLAVAYAGQTLPPLPATYADYVAFRTERRAHRADDDLAWWVSHLDGAPAVLELPGALPRPAMQTFGGASVSRTLDTDVDGFARATGVTPSAVLLAALGVVLSRLSGLPDLVIGSPMVDRRHADFEDMIGFFIDIAPLRLRCTPSMGFADWVRAARDELIAALAHPEAPLDRIVGALGLGGRFDRGPLVQVLFNMFNYEARPLDLPGVAAEPVSVPAAGSPFDLTVYGVERDGRLTVEIVYNVDVYRAGPMSALLDALGRVIAAGVAAPGTAVRDLLPDLPPPASPAVVARVHPRAAAPAVTEHPATASERAVAAVWCEVLGRAEVGATVSFFDAGGASLALVAVQHRLNRLLGRELRVVDLLRYPTVRSLAGFLDGSTSRAGDDAVDRAALRGAARRARRA